MSCDVIILGAGAAGLMTAIAAQEQGKKILILESNEKAGRKIIISGGGRCNFTNTHVTPEDYVSQNSHFCKSALAQFAPEDFIRLVKSAEISFYEKTLGQLFCEKSSAEILNMLLCKIDSPDCEIRTEVQIRSVQFSDGLFVVTSDGETFQGKNLVVATGGLSYPSLGASDLGYRLARQFGHKVTELRPALDGFVFFEEEQKLFEGLSGVSVEVTLKIQNKIFLENILFTHKGLSGPAALKASLLWRTGETLQIDFVPGLDNFQQWLETQREEHPQKLLSSILDFVLPKSLVPALVQKSGLPNKPLAALSKKEWILLEKNLKHFTLIPKKTVGYKKAEVTCGGVETSEISSKTMESKRVPGLFFVGEVLDVTGQLGGYNFQWAWSSGWVAGKNLKD